LYQTNCIKRIEKNRKRSKNQRKILNNKEKRKQRNLVSIERRSQHNMEKDIYYSTGVTTNFPSWIKIEQESVNSIILKAFSRPHDSIRRASKGKLLN
jgi:hypothetical protein